jgi:hypothetical protein
LLLSHGPPPPKSDVGGVPANKKPDGDTKPSNDLALSRDRGLERGTVDLTDQIKSIPRSHIEPEQDHIQYLDQPAIRLMLEREEKEREKKAESYVSILDRLSKTNEHSRRGIARTPEPELDKSRERSREPSLDRSRGR